MTHQASWVEEAKMNSTLLALSLVLVGCNKEEPTAEDTDALLPFFPRATEPPSPEAPPIHDIFDVTESEYVLSRRPHMPSLEARLVRPLTPQQDLEVVLRTCTNEVHPHCEILFENSSNSMSMVDLTLSEEPGELHVRYQPTEGWAGR